MQENNRFHVRVRNHGFSEEFRNDVRLISPQGKVLREIPECLAGDCTDRAEQELQQIADKLNASTHYGMSGTILDDKNDLWIVTCDAYCTKEEDKWECDLRNFVLLRGDFRLQFQHTFPDQFKQEAVDRFEAMIENEAWHLFHGHAESLTH